MAFEYQHTVSFADTGRRHCPFQSHVDLGRSRRARLVAECQRASHLAGQQSGWPRVHLDVLSATGAVWRFVAGKDNRR